MEQFKQTTNVYLRKRNQADLVARRSKYCALTDLYKAKYTIDKQTGKNILMNCINV